VKVWSHRGVEITTLCGHSHKANACDLRVTASHPHPRQQQQQQQGQQG